MLLLLSQLNQNLGYPNNIVRHNTVLALAPTQYGATSSDIGRREQSPGTQQAKHNASVGIEADGRFERIGCWD